MFVVLPADFRPRNDRRVRTRQEDEIAQLAVLNYCRSSAGRFALIGREEKRLYVFNLICQRRESYGEATRRVVKELSTRCNISKLNRPPNFSPSAPGLKIEIRAFTLRRAGSDRSDSKLQERARRISHRGVGRSCLSWIVINRPKTALCRQKKSESVA